MLEGEGDRARQKCWTGKRVKEGVRGRREREGERVGEEEDRSEVAAAQMAHEDFLILENPPTTTTSLTPLAPPR